MIVWLLGRGRRTKQCVLATVDGLAGALCLWLATSLRLGEVEPIDWELGRFLLVAAIATPAGFWLLGLYREVTRYIGGAFLIRLLQAVSLVMLAIWSSALLSTERGAGFPRTSVLIFGALILLVAGALRLLVRRLVGYGGRQTRRVAIYGAGDAGAGLAAVLGRDRATAVVAFFDDNPSVQGTRVGGVLVHPTDRIEAVVRRLRISHLLLALPSAKRFELSRALERARLSGAEVLSVPTLQEMTENRVRIDALRPISIHDLLGRPAVRCRVAQSRELVAGRCVLVTGAGGSIGSELCRQVLRAGPARLVLVDNCEFNLYRIHEELTRAVASSADATTPGVVEARLADVCDSVAMDRLFGQVRPDLVFHAAAYKHVPIVEANEVEGVRTNTLGTAVIADAAARHAVKRMILVSTDKAVHPTSVMGASKRLAELVVLAAQESAANTLFMAVRFGNVLGSSGSVVPIFAEQIARGGPVTVTHPDMTRYFMSIPEASALLIEAVTMGRGGEIFVLDMGEPVRIVDLARNMIQLSGRTVRDEANPTGEIAIQFTGLRPGEKLFEELVIGDQLQHTDHPAVLRAVDQTQGGRLMEPILERIRAAVDRHDPTELRLLLQTNAKLGVVQPD